MARPKLGRDVAALRKLAAREAAIEAELIMIRQKKKQLFAIIEASGGDEASAEPAPMENDGERQEPVGG